MHSAFHAQNFVHNRNRHERDLRESCHVTTFVSDATDEFVTCDAYFAAESSQISVPLLSFAVSLPFFAFVVADWTTSLPPAAVNARTSWSNETSAAARSIRATRG